MTPIHRTLFVGGYLWVGGTLTFYLAPIDYNIPLQPPVLIHIFTETLYLSHSQNTDFFGQNPMFGWFSRQFSSVSGGFA